MILICRDPKRFVAALNKERAGKLIQAAQRCLFNRSTPSHSTFRPIQALARGFAMPCTMPALNGRHFSTSPAPAIDCLQPSTHWMHQPARDHVATTSALTDSMKLIGPRGEEWFTGKQPKHCPGMTDGKLHSLPQVTLENLSKERLQAYFDNTWTIVETLLGSLQGEEAFMRSPYHDLRHPMIFYYGHPAAFYINKLRVAGLLHAPIDPYLESIFEVGVDEMSWDDLSKNKMPWPSVATVHAYRRKVYQTVSNVIANLPDESVKAINQESPLWALVMAFEHDRIHIETSSVLINELPKQFVRFPEGFPAYHPSIPSNAVSAPVAGEHYPLNAMLPVPAQTVTIGKPSSTPSFGWDNEYGHRSFDVPAFQASKYKISNGEFLQFVRDGGYGRQDLWTEAGWKWRAFRNVKWPVMWERTGPSGHHEYDLRTVFDVVKMPWAWPVVANYHEAVAYAKWKSEKDGVQYRILSELEHRAIRDESKSDHATMYGGNDVAKMGYNTNLAHSSMSPVNAYPANSKGFHDVFGNAWEWTEDYFCALPGFKVHPFYEDFSTPCFDGLHHVIQGGSFISTGDEASVHSRFHFRPHFHQHASFRLVQASVLLTSDTDAPGPFVGSYPFRRSKQQALQMQADKQTQQAAQDKSALLAKHFLPSPLDGSSAMGQLCNAIMSAVASNAEGRVLEVGCGLGGLSVQLAKSFRHVLGIDHHQDHVDFAKDIAQRLKGNKHELKVTLKGEGELIKDILVKLPKPQTNGVLDFRCADPMCVPAEMRDFDLVVINDVLDQLTSPNALLGRLGGMRGLVKTGGNLAVVSAYQWTPEATPKALWLGGFQDNHAVQSSEQGLVGRLADDFVHIKSMQLPLVWNETQHQLRGKVLTLTVFTRK